jgi:hypothetical protein
MTEKGKSSHLDEAYSQKQKNYYKFQITVDVIL